MKSLAIATIAMFAVGTTPGDCFGGSSFNRIDGSWNKIKGSGNGIWGNENSIWGNANGIKGHGNGIEGSYNSIWGNGNGVRGNGNGIEGSWNRVGGNHNAIRGNENSVWGNNNGVQTDDLDLAGDQRIQHDFVDIGAYESDFTTATREIIAGEIQLSPNPASDFIRLQLPKAIPAHLPISLFDPQGKLLEQQVYSAGQTIPIGHLPSGFYTLKLSDGDQVYIGRFVKQ